MGFLAGGEGERDSMMGGHGVCLIYAVHVVFAIARAGAQTLTQFAEMRKSGVHAVLTRSGRPLSGRICNNLVLAQRAIVGGQLRRNNGRSATVNWVLTMGGRRLRALLDTRREVLRPSGVLPPGLRDRLPYTCESTFKELGVTLNSTVAWRAMRMT